MMLQLFPLPNIKIIPNTNTYELLMYKMKPEAAILKSHTNMDFQDRVHDTRVSTETHILDEYFIDNPF